VDPNVASVFHLGRRGEEYFYAMEFVDGETLERVIRETGKVEVGLALEITGQVAAALSATHAKTHGLTPARSYNSPRDSSLRSSSL
jgi:eukaryotic-like serine/threonine-protein kinase